MSIYILKRFTGYEEDNRTDYEILAASNDLDEIIRLLPKVFNDTKEYILNNFGTDSYEYGYFVDCRVDLMIFHYDDKPQVYTYKSLYQVYKDGWDKKYSFGTLFDNLFELKDRKELSMLFSLSGYSLDSFEFENN